jgi:small subunit ribosomal protein S3
MGQKVNPVVFRLGLTQQWSSKWYSGKEYSQLLEQDIKIRKYLKTKIKEAGIDRIEIERSRGEITINITVAKPGLVIGRGGTGIEDLKKIIAQKFLPPKVNLKINVVEVDKINLSPGASMWEVCAESPYTAL